MREILTLSYRSGAKIAQLALGDRVTNIGFRFVALFVFCVLAFSSRLCFRSPTVFSGAPFGLSGTVVTLFQNMAEVVFDQEFLGATLLNGRCVAIPHILWPVSVSGAQL